MRINAKILPLTASLWCWAFGSATADSFDDAVKVKLEDLNVVGAAISVKLKVRYLAVC